MKKAQSRDAQSPDHLLGRVLGGRYRLDEKIGQGGMAYVYRATHTSLGGSFAVKVLFPHWVEDGILRQRFLREAQLQHQLQHPHIVRVLDVLEEEGLVCIVQEWCDGGDLVRWFRRRGQSLSEGELRSLFLPLVDAVAFAHEHGIIHRDIKPHNVLLQRQGGQWLPKLTDFGIAKQASGDSLGLTAAGTVMGTLQYMAPEQLCDSKKIDARADQYSLGVMLYELTTGSCPFVGELPSLIFKIISQEPSIPMATASTPLGDVLRRCLSKDAADRYSDCRGLWRALDQALAPSVSLGAWAHEALAPAHEASAPAPEVPDPFAATIPALERPIPSLPPAGSRSWARALLAAVLLLGVGAAASWGFFAHLQPDRSLSQEARENKASQAPKARSQDQVLVPHAPQIHNLMPPTDGKPQLLQTVLTRPHRSQPRRTQPRRTQPRRSRQIAPKKPILWRKQRPKRPKPLLQRASHKEPAPRKLRRRRRRRLSLARRCQIGSRHACWKLGQRALRRRKYRKALRPFRRACHLGEARACAQLARFWQYGRGVIGNCNRANRLYRTACHLGHRDSCRRGCVELPSFAPPPPPWGSRRGGTQEW